MASPAVLVNILEEHFEELQFLWPQRQSALRSPRYTLRELGELEGRIDAHVQGLLAGAEATRAFLEPFLGENDPVVAFAAAYSLLRFGNEDVDRLVLDAFLKAAGGQLDGIRDAFCHGPIEPVLMSLRRFFSAPPPATRLEVLAAVAEVLGFHGKLEIKTALLDSFLKHDRPALRQAGWRIVRYGPARTPETYLVGLHDADSRVRGEATLAAAWGHQANLLSLCRRSLTTPAPEHWPAIHMTAILGRPSELGYILPLAKAGELGVLRYRALGAYGHPKVVPELLTGMESKDPLSAVAAGAAFTKITGCDVESNRRVVVPPVDGAEADEFEREFLEEVKLPCVERALAHWSQVKDRFARGTRWCRGLDLSQGASAEIIAHLDMESRWEALLRGRFERTWHGSPSDIIEAFGLTATRR